MHFVRYAIQLEQVKGVNKKFTEKEEVKGMITKWVKDVVNDYLFDPDDRDAIRMHGKFTDDYPFAFSQCLMYTILHRFGIKMGDIVDIKAISELIGKNIKEIERRELFIEDLISSNENKGLKMLAKSVLDRKVITTEGNYIGCVKDVIFDNMSGCLERLLVNRQKGLHLIKKRISLSIEDVKLNMYSGSVIVKSSPSPPKSRFEKALGT
jgi:sporulation protein YlmC with PRC-barrel domain